VRRSSLVAFAAGCLVGSRRRRGGARRPRAVTLRGRPDSSRRPSDGVVAEASIVARLLRLRLLTLDATVVVSPAVVTEPSQQARPATRPARDVRAPLHGASPTAAPIGRRLAQAARIVDESAATLAATRREDAGRH
jgi:hypothetical protein